MLATAVLVPALVFAAAGWWNRGEVLREGSDAVQRTATIMDEHTAKVLDTADLLLARVADRIAGLDDAQVATPATSAFLRAAIAPFEQFVSLWVSDANGRVLAGSQAWDPAVSLADRPFFQEQRERRAGGALVSAAFTGRATNLASFAISRRRIDAEEGFAGVIHVALSPDYFTRFFAEAAPPFRHAAGLFRADGSILARHPTAARPRDRLGPDSPLLLRMQRGEARGLIAETSTLDGRSRLYAFRKVGTWPVYVGFGADADALLDQWRSNLLAYGAVAAAAALTLLLVSVLALRRARAAEAAEAALAREALARAAAEARQAAEAHFRAVFESRAIGLSIFDAESGVTLQANERLLEMTGGTRAAFEAGTWDWRRVTAPEHLERDDHAITEARARGWWDPYEKDYVRPDGSRLPVRLSSAPLPGEPGRLVVLVQDISEQREAELRRDLLMREVDHRAKNALATARAALRLTRAPTLAEFVREVDGRIGALAQALALLSTTQWQGVPLEALLRGELAPFLAAGGTPRAELRGPAVSIAAAAVQPLAMAVHELATNATKYGALSRQEGVLLLTWRLTAPAPVPAAEPPTSYPAEPPASYPAEPPASYPAEPPASGPAEPPASGPAEPQASDLAEPPAASAPPGGWLLLEWQERGGPPVTAPPADRGFGTRVLQATLARQLGGTLTLCWEIEGLRCEIALPAARVLAPAPAA
ncbi:PAS domain S-box protein [Paracraurococcus ruber]|nr:PAS domain S-box protein [Paracraurococcus ruber]